METPIIAAGIAFSSGIIVFVGTQWITHWREETKLLRQKAEELYHLLLKLRSQRISWLNAKVGIEASPWNSIREQSADLVMKITMLVRLYFPDLNGFNSGLLERAGGVVHLSWEKFRMITHDDLMLRLTDLDLAAHAVGEELIARNAKFTRSRWRDFFALGSAFRKDEDYPVFQVSISDLPDETEPEQTAAKSPA